MLDLMPLKAAQSACVLFATCTIGAGGCATAAVVCWRRARTRRAAHDKWITEKKSTEATTGDDLFDRWTEAVERQRDMMTARWATLIWCVAGALQTAIAAAAENGCL